MKATKEKDFQILAILMSACLLLCFCCCCCLWGVGGTKKRGLHYLLTANFLLASWQKVHLRSFSNKAQAALCPQMSVPQMEWYPDFSVATEAKKFIFAFYFPFCSTISICESLTANSGALRNGPVKVQGLRHEVSGLWHSTWSWRYQDSSKTCREHETFWFHKAQGHILT